MDTNINIIVNGLPETAPGGSTLAALIDHFGEAHPDLIAELNGRFIHSQDYAATKVMPGDRLEFIHAAFGG